MNKLVKSLLLLVALTAFTVACRGQSAQAQEGDQNLSKAPDYLVMLGKSLNDKDVIDFTSANCSPANQFQLCKEIGMALWIDSKQIVKNIWLYAGSVDGFQRYRGQLPYGLSFYDPLWRVEEKLDASNTNEFIPITGKDELQFEASSPDHAHYWVSYKRLNFVVIYDTPGLDEDAYIYAILVNSNTPL